MVTYRPSLNEPKVRKPLRDSLAWLRRGFSVEQLGRGNDWTARFAFRSDHSLLLTRRPFELDHDLRSRGVKCVRKSEEHGRLLLTGEFAVAVPRLGPPVQPALVVDLVLQFRQVLRHDRLDVDTLARELDHARQHRRTMPGNSLVAHRDLQELLALARLGVFLNSPALLQEAASIFGRQVLLNGSLGGRQTLLRLVS